MKTSLPFMLNYSLLGIFVSLNLLLCHLCSPVSAKATELDRFTVPALTQGNGNLGAVIAPDAENKRMIASANYASIYNTNAGASWAVGLNETNHEWDILTEIQYGNYAAGWRFGNSLAICDDVLAIGGSVADWGYSDVGHLDFFTETSLNNWTYVVSQRGPSDHWDNVGGSTACQANVTVTSARHAGNGRVLVFERDNGGDDNWGWSQHIIPGDLGTQDRFGEPLIWVENTLVVAAPTADPSGVDSGSVYVYNWEGGTTFTQVAKLIPDAGSDNLQYGWGLALDGDTLAVGTYYDDKVYIYYRNLGGTDAWGEVTTVNGPASSNFGLSLGINGDTLLVGSDEEDTTYGTSAGAVYIYHRNIGGVDNWGLAERITDFSGAAADARIGQEIMHYDGSLYLIGASEWNSGGGSVYFMNITVCGDGALDNPEEECDDGDLVDGDGCSSNCTIEYCGDGVLNNAGAEYCEPPGSATCDSSCVIICPYGTVAPSGNLDDCQPCPQGTFAVSSVALCEACPAGSTTAATGSVESDCLCEIGYYGTYADDCLPCPDGAVCSELGQTQPQAAPGYWADSSNSNIFMACASIEACPGGSDVAQCGTGYTGFLCGSCDDGYYAEGSVCKPCNNYVTTVAICLGVLAFVVFALFRVLRGGSTDAGALTSLGIFVNFSQTLISVGSFSVPWPPYLRWLLSSIEWLNFDLDTTAPECAVELNYYQKSLGKLLLPLAPLAILLVLATLVSVLIKIFKRNKNIHIAHASLGVFVSTLILFYNSLTLTSLDILRCAEREDGTVTLVSAPSVACYDEEWYGHLPLFLSGVGVYTFGLPLVLACAFQRGKRSESLYQVDGRGKWGSVWGAVSVDKFVRRFFWFEIVLMGKKVVVISSSQWATPFAQTLCGFMLMLGYVLLVAYAMPYGVRGMNQLELSGGVATLLMLFSGLVFGLAPDLDEVSTTLLTAMVIGAVGLTLLALVVELKMTIGGGSRRGRARVTPVGTQMVEWFGVKGVQALGDAPKAQRQAFTMAFDSAMEYKAAVTVFNVKMKEDPGPAMILLSISQLPTAGQRQAATKLFKTLVALNEGSEDDLKGETEVGNRSPSQPISSAPTTPNTRKPRGRPSIARY